MNPTDHPSFDLPPRSIEPTLAEYLAEFPAVVLLGPRQAGKTTLARQWVDRLGDKAVYLDLELPSARRQLEDAEAYCKMHSERLIVLDEVQRAPELFATLRGVIDERRRSGEAAGQFLLLGSASGVLLGQASESLAGRVAVLELSPFQLRELGQASEVADGVSAENRLWLRGGFPLSYLAKSDAASMRWRQAVITSYLERDIPALGLKIPAETLRRLWTMLAHHQGQMLNQSQLSAALAVSGQAITHYIDVLCDLMLVRRLPPWVSPAGNVGKRLVRSPKVYVRDCGLCHALLDLPKLESVLAHPIAGQSYEAMVIEQLITAAPQAQASFYRTAHGAEADLVLRLPQGETWVFEVKRSSAPVASRGFYEALKDVQSKRHFLVAPVPAAYPGRDGVQVMPVLQAVQLLAQQNG